MLATAAEARRSKCSFKPSVIYRYGTDAGRRFPCAAALTGVALQGHAALRPGRSPRAHAALWLGDKLTAKPVRRRLGTLARRAASDLNRIVALGAGPTKETALVDVLARDAGRHRAYAVEVNANPMNGGPPGADKLALGNAVRR